MTWATSLTLIRNQDRAILDKNTAYAPTIGKSPWECMGASTRRMLINTV